MATGRKTSLKPSTRAKGQLRVDQQAALRKQKAMAKTKKAAVAPKPKPKAKAAAKPKRKSSRTVGGVANLLRSRGRLPE